MRPSRKDFDDFRNFYGPSLSPDVLQTIARLEGDTSIWKSLESSLKTTSEFHTFLLEILDCAGRARWLVSNPQFLEAATAELESVIAACEKVRSHFEAIEINRLSDPQIAKFRKAIQWAEGFVGMQMRSLHLNATHAFPSSQKRRDPVPTFYVLLCRATEQHFKQPLYDLVATVTEVVFQTEREIYPDTVRAAVSRDKEKRARS